MFTTDLALKMDPEYRKIAMRLRENPEEFRLAFAKVWAKVMNLDPFDLQ
jgi:catalase-peroxidase